MISQFSKYFSNFPLSYLHCAYISSTEKSYTIKNINIFKKIALLTARILQLISLEIFGGENEQLESNLKMNRQKRLLP